jgi:hypothetical protein
MFQRTNLLKPITEPLQNYFYTTKHAANTATMPLVVPGVNNASASGNPKDEEWTKKLVGKKLHDSDSNETVSPPPLCLAPIAVFNADVFS